MGERKCAFEGCNALEFRTSGYCLRHKSELSDKTIVSSTSNSSVKKGSLMPVIGIFLLILGIPSTLFGLYFLMIVFGITGTSYFGFDIIPAIVFLSIGVPLVALGTALTFAVDSFKPKFSFDPSTGMYQEVSNINSVKDQQFSEE